MATFVSERLAQLRMPEPRFDSMRSAQDSDVTPRSLLLGSQLSGSGELLRGNMAASLQTYREIRCLHGPSDINQ
jgi:hypothetical protein